MKNNDAVTSKINCDVWRWLAMCVTRMLIDIIVIFCVLIANTMGHMYANFQYVLFVNL